MSLMQDYDQRTSWKWENIRGSIPTNPALTRKVNEDGMFLPFMGSTVVFRLDGFHSRVVQVMQRHIYQQLESTHMLAEQRLPVESLHLTLHDLVSPTHAKVSHVETTDGLYTAAYLEEVEESLRKARHVVDELQEKYRGKSIRMVADRLVNMVSSSLVLLLRPATEEDFELLAELYRAFDEVMPLPYPYTPHITIAYFRPGTVDGDRLGQVINEMQVSELNCLSISLPVEGITAQRFYDMRTYMDVPMRVCFCGEEAGNRRQVMAAHLLNSMARERNLLYQGFYRSSGSPEGVRGIPERVWTTLRTHGIDTEEEAYMARPLENEAASLYSEFALFSDQAISRANQLDIPEERYGNPSHFFFSRVPVSETASEEEILADLKERMEAYLMLEKKRW